MLSKQTILVTSLISRVLLLVLVAIPVGAQEWSRITFNIGGGVSPLVGQITSRLSTGWNVTVGGGYRFTSHFETNLQFAYHGLGVTQQLLAEAAVPNGNARVWSVTIDPKLRIGGERRLTPYVVGGVGYYQRTVEFTAPTVRQVFLFDPFFGIFFPTLEPANIVLGHISSGGIGGSLGGGFDVKIGDRANVFSEARWHYAETGSLPTRMVPVTFGFRW